MNISMDEKLYRQQQTLIRKECANYSGENNWCVGLDKKCPLMIFYKDGGGSPAYKSCSWFDKYVLIRDDKLLHDVLSSSSSEDFESKTCSVCGKLFVAGDGRQTACSACRALDPKMKKITKRVTRIGKR
jgi:hypothetical protein